MCARWRAADVRLNAKVKLMLRSFRVPLQFIRGRLCSSGTLHSVGWQSWAGSTFNMGPTFCPEVSINNYQPTPRNIPEEWRAHGFNPLKITGHVIHQQFNIQQLYVLPTTVFMCFVFIWEQTATCATYSINWLVFITQMKSVYCAVRTGSSKIKQSALRL